MISMSYGPAILLVLRMSARMVDDVGWLQIPFPGIDIMCVIMRRGVTTERVTPRGAGAGHGSERRPANQEADVNPP